MIWWTVRAWRLILIGWAEYLTGRAGYAVRPYDMLADRRRWFWQPRTPCGRSR